MQAPNNIDIGIGNCIDICTGTWLGRGLYYALNGLAQFPQDCKTARFLPGVSGVILREMELPQDCKTARFLHES